MYSGIHDTKDPEVLVPGSVPEWRYQDIGSLATAGLYSSADLDKLRKQIMYPGERRAINQVLMSVANSETQNLQGLDLTHFTDRATVEGFVKGYWEKSWNMFIRFGSVSSGFIGLLLVFKALKFLFDSIINGKALYDLYGCSWTLCASIYTQIICTLCQQASLVALLQPVGNG